MSAQIRDERFLAVIGDTVHLEKIGTGFAFTEGPVWHPTQHHLTFSDMPADHMRRWYPDGRIETFRMPSNMANGNAYDDQGRMVTCEHATSRLVRTEPDGLQTVLASQFEGKALNSPNDVVVRKDGKIYFTDPTYGRMAYYGIERDLELNCRGVYRVTPDGASIQQVADDFGQPNGLCFSLDHRRLFVNDTERGHIRCFDINDSGTISGGEVWADLTGDGPGHPDGMKIDAAGNLYCTGPGGVHVIAPDRLCLGVIEMPEMTANFTWGGADLKSLFFTASTSLYRALTQTPGLPAF